MTYEIVIDGSKPLVFKDEEALLSWCKKEYSAWQWATTVRDSNAINFIQPLTQLISVLNAVISSPNQSNLTNDVTNFLSGLNARIAGGSYIYSQSPLGEFILSEKEDNQSFAAKIMYLAAAAENTNIPKTQGYYFALNALSNFKRGISKRGANASLKAISKAHAELEALIKQERNQSEDRLGKLDALIYLREQKTEASTKTMAATLGKHKSSTRQEQHELRQQTKDAVDQLIHSLTIATTTIKETYESKMALQAPIQYWKDKAASHKTATKWFAALFVLYSALTLWLLISFIQSYGSGLQGFIASWNNVGIGAIASFAGLIGLGMLFARILYRLFASQLHLWNDAHERVVMIQTYLSLAQQGHAKEEFLGALLQRLFSPSTDGIVKSDLGSVGIIDAVTKISGGK